MKAYKRIGVIIMTLILSVSVVACAVPQETVQEIAPEAAQSTAPASTQEITPASTQETAQTSFTERDLYQSVDLSGASIVKLESGKNVDITKEGVYVISGTATNVTIRVAVGKEDKVQLVFDGVNITNDQTPAVTVISGDKVFVTTREKTHNVLTVTGTFVPDGEINTDAVIFSKSDLVLNGNGTLAINSSKGNGISSKDELEITGGTYIVTSYLDALEANDAILIYDGVINIFSDKDGLHSENNDDSSLGYIYIENGTLNIKAGDDAIRGSTFVQIDGGKINIESCVEGIEATTIRINGGEIAIYATDDGINATRKADGDVLIEVNGGSIKITMASGDTDAFDSNGNIVINGGVIEISAVSAFDADGTAVLNGGTVTVNGQVITEITVTQMGPGGMRPGGANPGATNPGGVNPGRKRP